MLDNFVHTGNTNTAIRFSGADTITADTGGSERVRVDSSGKVAIGTTSPATNLDVKTEHASNEANFYVRNNTVNYKVRTLSDQVQAGTESNHPFYSYE